MEEAKKDYVQRIKTLKAR